MQFPGPMSLAYKSSSLPFFIISCSDKSIIISGDRKEVFNENIDIKINTDAGFFLKRARAVEAAFGGQSFHRRRYISHFGI